MTAIWSGGFEEGTIGTAGQYWDTITGTISVQSTTKRSGSYALRSNPTAGTGYVRKNISGSPTVLVARFYVYFASFPTADCELFTAGVYNLNSLRISFNVAQQKITLNDAIPGSVGTPVVQNVTLSLNTWYRIDARFNCGANPKTTEIQINGAAGSSFSSAQAATYFTNFRFGALASTTADVIFDDAVVSVTSGDYPIGPDAAQGSQAVNLEAMTGTAAGGVKIAGAQSTTLAGMTGTAAGTVTTPGTQGSQAVSLEAMTGTGAGGVKIGGAQSTTLTGMTGTGAGGVKISGSQAATLAAMACTAAGTTTTPEIHGAQAASLAGMTSTGAGGVEVKGSQAASLGAMTSTGAGGVKISGSQAVTLAAMICTAAGAATWPEIHGAQAASLAGMTGTGAGVLGEWVVGRGRITALERAAGVSTATRFAQAAASERAASVKGSEA